MKRTGPTKPSTKELIRRLEKESISRKETIWRTISRLLEAPSRGSIAVNVGKLGLLSKKFPKKVLLVPGKILGTGALDAPITVCGYEFSESAVKKIEKAKGKALTIPQLLESKEKIAQIMLVK
ncbi:MAG: 50S ribosomal protein L18e [Candidatus Diapherotrites archaeon]|uniref:50S ribosomal protein L18e n=1 Tax=Candidatus Iainarchaeum sp. TaxID=3101447 RepID=A0A8T4L452_9ARCH|nr:50S ribosomal protein L18e [Candidatus Diapherotrites archaeon]